MNELTVHISIDDVGASLRYLTMARMNSLFDLRLYGKLVEWHEKYDAKFSLYCFALADQFMISEIPDFYARDFSVSADWLKLGYHGKCTVPFAEEAGYEAGFDLVDNTLTRLGAGKTDTLRLHCWRATPEQKEFLRRKGVAALLYYDDDCLRYDENDTFLHCGLIHRRTRVRFENISEVTSDALCVGRKNIAAFTHEWCFDKEAEKMEIALRFYKEHGYEFIT
jgi:hypothetical protein